MPKNLLSLENWVSFPTPPWHVERFLSSLRIFSLFFSPGMLSERSESKHLFGKSTNHKNKNSPRSFDSSLQKQTSAQDAKYYGEIENKIHIWCLLIYHNFNYRLRSWRAALRDFRLSLQSPFVHENSLLTKLLRATALCFRCKTPKSMEFYTHTNLTLKRPLHGAINVGIASQCPFWKYNHTFVTIDWLIF